MVRYAFVCQRYGKEVIGGSETYTRDMAEHLAVYLKGKAQIEVLTSKAKDFKTWANWYEKDTEVINDVTVRRFDVTKGRNPFLQRGGKILMRKFGIRSRRIEENRVRGRGPYVPGLIRYIKEHKDEYDKFIFVTYMYYPTYFGTKEVLDKAVLISTAHDEEPIHMDIYREMFNGVSGMIYLTEEEKAFVERTFGNEIVNNKVIGMGIEVPEEADGDAFKEKFKIKDDYLLYAGRLEEDKGVGKLVDHFMRYKYEKGLGENEGPVLVLMGKGGMKIPERKDIVCTGFVDEKTKFDGMKGASVICLPSAFESFSISLLEGMALGKPALVNGESEVLKGHINKSGGGLVYLGYDSFKEGLEKLLYGNKTGETDKMKEKAAAYVKENYSYENIMRSFEEML